MSTTRQILALLLTSLDADDRTLDLLTQLNQRVQTMDATLQDLSTKIDAQGAQITTMQTTIDSVQETIAATVATKDALLAERADTITALNAKIAEMQANGVDMADVAALAAKLDEQSTALGAAVQDLADTFPKPVVDPAPVAP